MNKNREVMYCSKCKTVMNPVKLGATGKFPDGKLTPEDEGELRMAITEKDGNIIIDFGKPVSWIGLAPDIARSLAEKLLSLIK